MIVKDLQFFDREYFYRNFRMTPENFNFRCLGLIRIFPNQYPAAHARFRSWKNPTFLVVAAFCRNKKPTFCSKWRRNKNGIKTYILVNSYIYFTALLIWCKLNKNKNGCAVNKQTWRMKTQHFFVNFDIIHITKFITLFITFIILLQNLFDDTYYLILCIINKFLHKHSIFT